MSYSSDLFIYVFHATIEWFNQHKRILPWRNSDDPYSVWISEIMLQQTQVEVVIPYYYRWKELFPNLEALANAKLEEVFQAFAGLGYYSRAKNIHSAAKICHESFSGCMPKNFEDLLKLPGIGRYTAGAIVSFAYKQKGVAVDGNVLRVVTRLLGIKDPIDLPKTRDQVEKFIDLNTPEKNFHIFMEGLIEIGAMVCKKKPNCIACPLRSRCYAFHHRETELIPVKFKVQKTVELDISIFIYQKGTRFYIEQKQDGEWNSGLYEFPSDEKILGINMEEAITLKPFYAFITKHKLFIIPKLIIIEDRWLEGLENWKTLEEIDQLPLSSSHRKIVSILKKLESQPSVTPT